MTPDSLPDKPRQPRAWPLYLFLGLFFLIGSGTLVFSAVKLVKTVHFLGNSAVTTGAVDDLVMRRGSKGGSTYAPAVTFHSSSGELHRFVSALSSGSPDYAVGQQVPVRFDPERPELAEINEFIPLWFPVILRALFGIAFVTAPLGILYFSRRELRRNQARSAALAQGVPAWQADPEWRDGRIQSTLRTQTGFFLWFAILWNTIALPCGLFGVKEVLKGNWIALVALLFPLVGLGLISKAATSALQQRRFGDLTLVMNPFPACIGGEVGGTLLVPLTPQPGSHFHVTLCCLAIAQRTNNAQESLLWSASGAGLATPASSGTSVAFRFAVPPELAASDELHRWTVTVAADLPGPDLDATFIIPMEAATPPLHSTLTIPFSEAQVALSDLPASQVRVEELGDRVILDYPARRNLAAGLITLLVGALFAAFLFFALSRGNVFMLIILPFFGLFALGLIGYGLWSLGNGLTVTAGQDELRVARRFFGLSLGEKTLSVTACSRIEIVRAGQVGTGSAARLLFTLKAQLRGGETLTLGNGISGRGAAETLGRLISEKTGIVVGS